MDQKPTDRTRVAQIEDELLKISKPLLWWGIVKSIFGLIIIVVGISLILNFGCKTHGCTVQNDWPIFAFAGFFTVVLIGMIVSNIYEAIIGTRPFKKGGHVQSKRFSNIYTVFWVIIVGLFSIPFILTPNLRWVTLPLFALMIFMLLYARLYNRKYEEPLQATATDVSADEKVEFSLGGIMRADGYTDPMSGRGVHPFPENAIIATNKRVYFVYIPVGAGDEIVQGVDIRSLEVTFARKEIKSKLETTLKSQKLEQIIKSHFKNHALDRNGLKVKFSKLTGNFIFTPKAGKSLRVIVLEKSDEQALKTFFHL